MVSVIIVNFNACFFAEQCLHSVQKSLKEFEKSIPGRGSETEIILVDNASADQSPEFLPRRFPLVKFILNKENGGFARANNEALQSAAGKYILFLNPDTILPEDFFIKTIGFMENHPDAGALGVRMLDGDGKYLKESKRGFPRPLTSFFKITGLAAAFPRSGFFARYYLGNLTEKETAPAEVLSGACLLATQESLKRAGSFDERFFMYAEDIDLSYRIQQAGFRNYYFPETSILHFKGESTPKDVRQIRLFYKAMSQFVHKYYRSIPQALFAYLLDAAILFRAVLAILALPFLKKGEKCRGSSSHFFPLGDEKSRQETLKKGLYSVTDSPEKATDTVYCEGRLLSFREIIELFETDERRKWIHADESSSVVGSPTRKTTGCTIFLNS